MSFSSTALRRGLGALIIAGALGFGSAQAFASPEQARAKTCDPYNPNGNWGCNIGCPAGG